MQNYFKDILRKALEEKCNATQWVVEGKTVKANMGEVEYFIVRTKGVDSAPNIYIEESRQDYLKGKSINKIVDEYFEYVSHPINFNADIIKKIPTERIKVRLYQEQDESFIKAIPNAKFQDLVLVCYIEIEEGATVNITNELIKSWNTTFEEILKVALKNLEDEKITVLAMGEMIGNLLEIDTEIEELMQVPMYVATNSEKFLGARVLLRRDILKRFANKINSSFYIIPSSVHELIFLPSEMVELESDLLDMIRDVNRELEVKEVLSNNAYYYDKEKDEIRIIS